MGGSVGKILGTVAGVALAPFTGGSSLLYALGGMAAGETLVDAPARAAKAQDQAAQRAEQARQDALTAAQAKKTEMATGVGQVDRKGATTIGEADKKDTRAAIRKKKEGAGKLRIDPMAANSAAGGAATTGDSGLKV